MEEEEAEAEVRTELTKSSPWGGTREALPLTVGNSCTLFSVQGRFYSVPGTLYLQQCGVFSSPGSLVEVKPVPAEAAEQHHQQHSTGGKVWQSTDINVLYSCTPYLGGSLRAMTTPM